MLLVGRLEGMFMNEVVLIRASKPDKLRFPLLRRWSGGGIHRVVSLEQHFFYSLTTLSHSINSKQKMYTYLKDRRRVQSSFARDVMGLLYTQ